MRQLLVEPAVPFLLPDMPFMIAVVGCGGTGSAVAQHVARLAAHLDDTGGTRVDVLLIDGDTVEPRNIGRQLFARAEVGRNKAQTLAARLARALAIPVRAVAAMATVELLEQLAPPPGRYGVLVGAVDGAAGRQVLAEVLGRHNGWRLWLDCGNHEHSGQVVVGSVTRVEHLQGAFALDGLCTALPAPTLVYPALLAADASPPGDDCATAMLDNRQSLLVNHQIATTAAQYLSDCVFARRLTRFETVVDGQALSMRSTPITAAQVAASCQISRDVLTAARAVTHGGTQR